MRIRAFVAGCLAILLALASPTLAEEPAQPRPGEVTEAEQQLGFLMLGNHVFIFLHELGHALVEELDLPIVGQEEDAVDEFATVALIAFARDEKTSPEDREAFYGYAGAGALAFIELWKVLEREVGGKAANLPFWDEHALELKRVTNIMCLLYGADPARFKTMADHFTMPEDRRERCEVDYPKRDRAWTRLLTPHLQPTTGERRPSGTLRVKYGTSNSPGAKQMEASIRQVRMFETFADIVNQLFVLPNDITIVSRDCNEANAFWNPNDRTITMCYELMARVGTLIAQSGQAAPVTQPEAKPETPPQADPPPAVDPAAQYYVAEDRKPVGPLSLDQLLARIAAKTMGPTDLVWKAGTPDWVEAQRLPELKGALAN